MGHGNSSRSLEGRKGPVDEFGQSFELVGERNGVTYYAFVFPDKLVTGFPIVFSYEKGKPAETITGFEALDIVCSFTK